MSTPEPQALLARLIDAARAAGADAADALFTQSVSVGASVRLGRLEDLERAESFDIGLRVIIGARQAVVSATDISDGTLAGLPDKALAMAREAPDDPWCGLAPSERLARSMPDLDLLDPAEPSAESLIDRARACEDAARSRPGITNSEGGSASWGRGTVALATSAGFFGSYESSSHSVSVSVLAGSGSAMERDYDYASSRHLEDLEDAEAVGRRAAERTLARLGPRKLKSAAMPVVFDPRISGGLVGHLVGAISGPAIARGVSFLKDRLGRPVFAKGVTIREQALRRRGLRSRSFDGEGVAAADRTLIEDGVLTTWLLNAASARQLGLQTTGHAARGTGGPPGIGTANLHMEPGAEAREAMIGAIPRGLYVTELIGMGVNGVTGDYSRGAAGFLIENGAIAHPVSEVTIAGNLKDMFARLTPANDLEFRYATNAPTVLIDGMTVAGG